MVESVSSANFALIRTLSSARGIIPMDSTMQMLHFNFSQIQEEVQVSAIRVQILRCFRRVRGVVQMDFQCKCCISIFHSVKSGRNAAWEKT